MKQRSLDERRKVMARKVDLTVKVSQSVVDALDLIVRASNGEKTRSELVRQALDQFIVRKGASNAVPL